jgi:hypothetical protein
MPQPQCYVIAHQSSPVVDNCVQSLEQHGWSYEIFPAVDGSRVTEADWQRTGIAMSDLGKIKRRPGAQGCWLSHFAVWSQCIKQGRPVIILEHDALVTEPWPSNMDLDTQLIKLYSSAECKINPAFGLWSKGSHAYTLTPAQAQRIIDHARKNGAQAVDKHLGDQVLPWTFFNRDLVTLNPGRGRSSTSAIK